MVICEFTKGTSCLILICGLWVVCCEFLETNGHASVNCMQLYLLSARRWINTLRLRQNGHHFAEHIFMKEKV